MICRSLCTLLLLVLAGSCAFARDIFVDNVGGDDLNLGNAPTASNVGGGPCRTIGRALRLAQSGDRIMLANTGEPYRECIALQAARHSGNARRPFVIAGNGATLDGSRPVNPEAWEHVQDDVFRFRPARTSYQQLFLSDAPLFRVPVKTNDTLPALKPFQWCLFDRHIYINLKKPVVVDENTPLREREDAYVPEEVKQRAKTEGWRYLPQQYAFKHTFHPVGITLYNVRNVIIADLLVQDFQLDGINAHDKAYGVQIDGVTCRDNGRSGISVGGASRVRISDSSLRFNGAAQLRAEGQSAVEVVASQLLAIDSPSVVRDGGAVTIDGRPLQSTVYNKDIDPPPAPAAP